MLVYQLTCGGGTSVLNRKLRRKHSLWDWYPCLLDTCTSLTTTLQHISRTRRAFQLCKCCARKLLQVCPFHSQWSKVHVPAVRLVRARTTIFCLSFIFRCFHTFLCFCSAHLSKAFSLFLRLPFFQRALLKLSTTQLCVNFLCLDIFLFVHASAHFGFLKPCGWSWSAWICGIVPSGKEIIQLQAGVPVVGPNEIALWGPCGGCSYLLLSRLGGVRGGAAHRSSSIWTGWVCCGLVNGKLPLLPQLRFSPAWDWRQHSSSQARGFCWYLCLSRLHFILPKSSVFVNEEDTLNIYMSNKMQHVLVSSISFLVSVERAGHSSNVSTSGGSTHGLPPKWNPVSIWNTQRTTLCWHRCFLCEVRRTMDVSNCSYLSLIKHIHPGNEHSLLWKLDLSLSTVQD